MALVRSYNGTSTATITAPTTEASTRVIAGTIAVGVIVFVAMGRLDYDSWTALAGSTIWCKFFASFILGRHANPNFGKKKD